MTTPIAHFIPTRAIRILVPAFTLALALTGGASAVFGTGTPASRRVQLLDGLVTLDDAQKAQASRIFTEEEAALRVFTTPEERLKKGISLRKNARAQIRALLTPIQQTIYDSSPQRLGGGALRDTAAIVSRIDSIVTFTDQQLLRAAAIYQQQTIALQALTEAQRRAGEAAPLHKATREQIRALLTPDQQQKFDANPRQLIDLEERAFVLAFIQASSAIAQRFGSETTLSLKGSTRSTTASKQQQESMKGTYTYLITGNKRTEGIVVSWVRDRPSMSIRITAVVCGDGTVLTF